MKFDAGENAFTGTIPSELGLATRLGKKAMLAKKIPSFSKRFRTLIKVEFSYILFIF